MFLGTTDLAVTQRQLAEARRARQEESEKEREDRELARITRKRDESLDYCRVGDNGKERPQGV